MVEKSSERENIDKYVILKNKLGIANKEILNLSKENTKLEKEIDSIKNNFGRQLADIKSQHEKKLNRQLDNWLKERGEKSSKEEWEKIIDEMAHSINSDLQVALYNLRKFSSKLDPESIRYTDKALNHTKQIGNLIDLIMLYLKRKEIKFSGATIDVSVDKYVNEQISTIKNSLSTLRLSVEEHQELLEKIEVPVETAGDMNLNIPIELKDAISLIIKDLLRNAFKNTLEENPKISIKIEGEENQIKLIIKNNKAISDDFSNWFNGKSNVEPKMSKSSKVGLRVILKWTKYLGINAVLKANIEENSTIAELTIPRKIKYEK